MARTRIHRGERVTTPVYVVDDSVRRGQANQRDDVLLIQFMLRALASKRAGKTGELFQVPGAAPLAIDGFFGQQTSAAITRFQKLVSDLDGDAKWKMRQDGIVNPLDGRPSLPGNSPPMLHLNWAYQLEFGDFEHAHMHLNPLFPDELTPKLYF